MKYLFWWLFAAVVITALCSGLYLVGQQVYRQSINDLPVQLAGDIGREWDMGILPASTTPVEMSLSLAPWYIIYDKNGNPIAGNGHLHGSLPKLPDGVLQNASWWAHGHSWQPESGVRQDIAIYVVGRMDHDEYVVAGHSMSEMELHIAKLGEQVLFGWGVLMVIISALQLLYVFGRRIARRS